MENTHSPKRKRIAPNTPVKIIIKRNFSGEKNLADLLIPIICNDLKKKLASEGLDQTSANSKEDENGKDI